VTNGARDRLNTRARGGEEQRQRRPAARALKMARAAAGSGPPLRMRKSACAGEAGGQDAEQIERHSPGEASHPETYSFVVSTVGEVAWCCQQGHGRVLTLMRARLCVSHRGQSSRRLPGARSACLYLDMFRESSKLPSLPASCGAHENAA